MTLNKGGLTIITAAIFLAGEMAGSGVLALPYAILGTGRKDHGPNIYKDARPPKCRLFLKIDL